MKVGIFQALSGDTDNTSANIIKAKTMKHHLSGRNKAPFKREKKEINLPVEGENTVGYMWACRGETRSGVLGHSDDLLNFLNEHPFPRSRNWKNGFPPKDLPGFNLEAGISFENQDRKLNFNAICAPNVGFGIEGSQFRGFSLPGYHFLAPNTT